MPRTVALLLASLIWAQAHAHHSFATHYDTSNIVEISGKLTDIKIRSPHSFFSVDVVNADGQTESWDVEAHALPLLRRLGIEKDTFSIGDDITFRGPRSRRPEKLLLFGAQIETPDGLRIEMLNSLRRPPEEKITDARVDVAGVDRLTGKWLTYITGQRVADSPMPLNDAGRSARENFDPTVNPASECVPPNLPSLLMIPYVYEISRDGNTVTLFHEYAGLSRPVVLNSRVPNMTDPQFGRRTGRFEDNALIIESKDFPALPAGLASGWEPNGNGADIPSSARKTLVEKYSVNADGSELTLAYTVTDPAFLTMPYAATVVWHRIADDTPVYAFDCDAEIALRSTRNAAPLNDE